MNAITRSEYGSPREVVELNEIDMPVIKDDEVLVRVRAATVNADVPVVVRGSVHRPSRDKACEGKSDL
jgi:NADPH:quinone reductase-like Zn-dependent oxidoreductase